ncbi:MAG: hypothetical protein NTW33_05720 [Methanoregula sp.]|nr:hypothetical protein [Methanoregula sp.]
MTDIPPARDPEDAPIKKWLITLCLTGEILVNAYIIWYFLVGMPAACAHLAEITGGRETCEAGTGAPVIMLISAVLIVAGLVLLWRMYCSKRPGANP